MAQQATTTVVGDLRKLLASLLDRDPDGAWGHSKLLIESIECAGADGLPTRVELAALLAEVLSRELRHLLDQPAIQ